MLDDRGVLLYVGKAKSIRNRVRSYFQSVDRLDVKTRHLVAHIASIETIAVRSESEALILESQLIKEFQPRYNILLKDDKAFPYIKITGELFPRLQIVRERTRDGGLYFGPYPSIGSSRAVRRMLQDMFKLRDCSQSITLDEMQPKCIKLDIHKCLGPCVLKHVKQEYDSVVQQLKKVLTGKKKQLINELKTEMGDAAKEQRYEQAAECRDRIRKLELLGQRQTVCLDDVGRLQLWTAAEERGFLYIIVQTLVDGKLLYQNGYYLESPSDESRETMVQQSILTCWSESEIPDSVICDPWLFDIVTRVWTNSGFKPGSIIVPKRGLKLELLESARQNARLAIGRIIRDRSIVSIRPKAEDILGLLQQTLKLRNRPDRIVGVDISHLQGTNIVGVAVYFKRGNPYKSGYRKMMIRSVVGDSNDPQSIYEVVSRRLQLCFAEHEPLPDLMVIDGGKGQLNFAYKALVELGLENVVDLVSLAKQNEELFRIDDPNSLVLSKDDNVLKLIQRIRDESHRFAVTFQRKKRKQQLETSALHSIPGLGPKRIQKLYRHFHNLEKLLQASDIEIATIGGFSPSLASRILSKLKTISTHE